MRLAVSNLAWPAEQESAAVARLAALGVAGVEVAPTRIADWPALTPGVLAGYRGRLADSGLVVSSLQAILFGCSDLLLLGDDRSFTGLCEHLRRVTDIGAGLGGRVLVFGAPKNRLRGQLPIETAWSLAVDRLRLLGEIAAAVDTVIAIEPVPPFYGGDFLTGWRDVLGVVREIDHAGVRVHLDTGCVALHDDSIGEAVAECAEWLAHFHAAQPELGSFARPLENHAEAAAALRASGYDKWISIEMREQQRDPIGEMATAVQTVQHLYAL